jgi:hypothetical protein
MPATNVSAPATRLLSSITPIMRRSTAATCVAIFWHTRRCRGWSLLLAWLQCAAGRRLLSSVLQSGNRDGVVVRRLPTTTAQDDVAVRIAPRKQDRRLPCLGVPEERMRIGCEQDFEIRCEASRSLVPTDLATHAGTFNWLIVADTRSVLDGLPAYRIKVTPLISC